MDTVIRTPEKHSDVVADADTENVVKDKKLGETNDFEDRENDLRENLDCIVNVNPPKTFQSLDLPGPQPRTKDVSRNGNASALSKTPKPLSGLSVSLGYKSTPPLKKGSSALENNTSGQPNTDTPEKADSVRSTRATEAERRAYFENHLDVLEVEPHRVRCRCCNQWLKLSNSQRYSLGPWNLHRKLCTQDKPSRKRRRLDHGLNDDSFGGETDTRDDDSSSIAPSVSASDRTSVSVVRVRRTWTERKRILEEDEYSGEVREDSVFCVKCGKWVKLGRPPYRLRPWLTHTERVHGRPASNLEGDISASAPSSRVLEAERKLQLVNDAQVTEFTATKVTCRLCSTEVQLSTSIAYQLDNWLAHKSSCSGVLSTSPLPEKQLSKPTPRNGSGSPCVEATPSGLRPEPGSGPISTDGSPVHAHTGPEGDLLRSHSPKVGKKRSREEYEGGKEHGDEGSSTSLRSRTESYTTPDEKPPSAWAWIWQPWEIFKRGFAEGMGEKGTS